MACKCSSDEKIIQIKRITASPTYNDNSREILNKTCSTDESVKLVSSDDKLIVFLEFSNTVVTAVELFSNFKTMKVYFSQVKIDDYVKRRPAYQHTLRRCYTDYRCQKSAIRMSILLEGGNELYALKIRGKAPGITQPVQTKYETLSTHESISTINPQSWYIQ